MLLLQRLFNLLVTKRKRCQRKINLILMIIVRLILKKKKNKVKNQLSKLSIHLRLRILTLTDVWMDFHETSLYFSATCVEI